MPIVVKVGGFCWVTVIEHALIVIWQSTVCFSVSYHLVFCCVVAYWLWLTATSVLQRDRLCPRHWPDSCRHGAHWSHHYWLQRQCTSVHAQQQDCDDLWERDCRHNAASFHSHRQGHWTQQTLHVCSTLVIVSLISTRLCSASLQVFSMPWQHHGTLSLHRFYVCQSLSCIVLSQWNCIVVDWLIDWLSLNISVLWLFLWCGDSRLPVPVHWGLSFN